MRKFILDALFLAALGVVLAITTVMADRTVGALLERHESPEQEFDRGLRTMRHATERTMLAKE